MRGKNRRIDPEKEKLKSILYISGSILGLAIIAVVITFIISGNNKTSQLDSQKIASLIPNTNQIEQTSSSIGKTVEEQKNTLNEASNTVVENKVQNNVVSENVNNTSKNEIKQEVKEEPVKQETKKVEVKKDPTFIKPVDGEVTKAFAKDNLIYSDTLKEWVTHLGIDYKAEKTSVVKAAANGTVKTITNDPRYGLTIVIKHDNGFESVYSNLLSTEFVVEKEDVKQGQTIGTVGNTAAFEILDEPHLHFEILKDSVAQDPNSYIK